MTKILKEYNLFEVFYRKNGIKRSAVLNNVREVNQIRRSLKRNKRKFLGVRELTLAEIG